MCLSVSTPLLGLTRFRERACGLSRRTKPGQKSGPMLGCPETYNIKPSWARSLHELHFIRIQWWTNGLSLVLFHRLVWREKSFMSLLRGDHTGYSGLMPRGGDLLLHGTRYCQTQSSLIMLYQMREWNIWSSKLGWRKFGSYNSKASNFFIAGILRYARRRRSCCSQSNKYVQRHGLGQW